jgi:DNA polymerase II large subunit
MSSSESVGRNRIDWDAAFEYYAALGAVRSFGKVARRFGVSDVAVGLRARSHEWRHRVQEIDQKTREEVERRVVRDRAIRLADTINVVDKARTEILDKLEKGEADVRLSDMPALIKLELLLEGEATDRIETTEVRQLVVQVFEIAGRFIPVKQRAEFLKAVGELSGSVGGSESVLELYAEEVDES